MSSHFMNMKWTGILILKHKLYLSHQFYYMWRKIRPKRRKCYRTTTNRIRHRHIGYNNKILIKMTWGRCFLSMFLVAFLFMKYLRLRTFRRQRIEASWMKLPTNQQLLLYDFRIYQSTSSWATKLMWKPNKKKAFRQSNQMPFILLDAQNTK